MSGEKCRKFFFNVPHNFFGFTGKISRFDERFRNVQYSLASFLFARSSTHGAPCARPFVKVGARAPSALWSRLHWMEFDTYAWFPALRFRSSV